MKVSLGEESREKKKRGKKEKCPSLLPGAPRFALFETWDSPAVINPVFCQQPMTDDRQLIETQEAIEISLNGLLFMPAATYSSIQYFRNPFLGN
jgi:hypothetical protein